MRYTLILLFIILYSYMSVAQMVSVKERPSFYLGKRGVIDMSMCLQPSFSPSKSEPYDSDKSEYKILPIYMNMRPELKYTFALTNKFGFYAKGALNKSSRNSQVEDTYSSNEYTVPVDEWNTNYYLERGMPVLKGSTFGAGLTWFLLRKASIAPIGSYLSIGVNRHSYKNSYKDVYLTNYYDVGSPTILLDGNSSEFKYTSFEMEAGLNELITKNLYYSLAFSSSFNFGLNKLLSTGSSSERSVQEQSELFDRTSLAFKDLAVLKIGLGYVLH